MNEMVSSGTKRPRILNCKRRECLRLFENGCGYKKTAKETGLNAYTVREYLRRYRNGDVSWAERGQDCPAAAEHQTGSDRRCLRAFR